MSCSHFKPKAVLVCALALAAAGPGRAQTSYTNSGGEYAIAGSLPGDQLWPSLSINSSGGYLVWEDNALSPTGTRIRAVALDNTLRANQAPLRVSTNSLGNQERPRVALLSDGGAAFAWQGGRESRQHVYARFINASNDWVSGDLQVSTTNGFQVQPALATLSNGNVVVVFGSYNQYSSTSMQDVYGQILSPSGQKIGANFLVNQFTSYNQRTPSVAALPDGGFAVVWISEQQRNGVTAASTVVITTNAVVTTNGNVITTNNVVVTNSDPFVVSGSAVTLNQLYRPSVDVYGRLFGADGAPLGDETLINLDTDSCSSPQVVAGSDGSLLVAWAQKNQQSLLDRSWDIFARSFPAGTGLTNGGAALTVNTFLNGDQFGPQVAVLGTNYLIAWTSLGQGRKFEGVFGRFLNGDGTASGNEFAVNTTTSGRQFQPAVASDGSARFAAVWSSFTWTASDKWADTVNGPGWANGFDLYAQLYAPATYTAPTPAALYAVPATTPDSDPVVDRTADQPILPDPAPPTTKSPYPGVLGLYLTNLTGVTGTYSGLFSDTNGVFVKNSGYFTATTTKKGTNYTAKILLGGKTYSWSGLFSANGTATNVIKRSGDTNLSVTLQMTESGLMIGTFSNLTSGGWSSDLVAFRQTFNQKTNPCAQAGKFTAAIPGGSNSVASPAGSGVATASISTLGVVAAGGTLADGTRFTQSGVISGAGFWPFYSSLYSGKGVAVSWVAVTNGGLGGSLFWVRASKVSPSLYPNGFTNVTELQGSAYSYSSKAPALALTNGLITLNGAWVTNLVNKFTLDAKKGFVPGANKLALSFQTGTGLLNGSATVGRTRYTFQAVVMQNSTNGQGFFLNSGQSGSVDIEPAAGQ